MVECITCGRKIKDPALGDFCLVCNVMGRRADNEQKEEQTREEDPVNHPKHYTNHPSGIECIQITEHMGFNLGNALKYIWRCDLKKDAIEDLEKAMWYIKREIKKRTYTK